MFQPIRDLGRIGWMAQLGGLCLLVVAMALSTVQPLYAQSEPMVVAEVDRTSIPLDDVVDLRVEVWAAEPMRPHLPDLDGFEIVNSRTETQLRMTQNDLGLHYVYHYYLRPTRAGELSIDPIYVILDGRTYMTAPIRVNVTDSSPAQPAPTKRKMTIQVHPPTSQSTAPGSGPSSVFDSSLDDLLDNDVFAEAEVDNPTPYLGEQVIYTFRLYEASALYGQPQYNPPDFAGFWTQETLEEREYMVERDNQYYLVREIRTLLFPAVAGQRTIGPATLTFESSLLGNTGTVQADPVELTVRPQPAPAPASFDGAVGRQVTIAATADVERVAVGEPVTLQVTVRGEGHIETWPDPMLPEWPDWQIFEENSTIQADVEDERLRGSRVYEYMLVPKKAGDYTLPAIQYSYFDPEAERYQTLSTQPMPVVVAPGAPEQTLPVAALQNAQENVQEAQQDLASRLKASVQLVEPVQALLASTAASLVESRIVHAAWAVPLLFLATAQVRRWRRRRQLTTPPGHRRRVQAHKKARNLLSEAQRHQADDLYGVICLALTGYLGDKLNQPVRGLTQPMLVQRLREHELDDALIRRVGEVLMRSEMERFGPVRMRDSGESLLKETEKLILDLEKAL